MHPSAHPHALRPSPASSQCDEISGGRRDLCAAATRSRQSWYTPTRPTLAQPHSPLRAGPRRRRRAQGRTPPARCCRPLRPGPARGSRSRTLTGSRPPWRETAAGGCQGHASRFRCPRENGPLGPAPTVTLPPFPPWPYAPDPVRQGPSATPADKLKGSCIHATRTDHSVRRRPSSSVPCRPRPFTPNHACQCAMLPAVAARPAPWKQLAHADRQLAAVERDCRRGLPGTCF